MNPFTPNSRLASVAFDYLLIVVVTLALGVVW